MAASTDFTIIGEEVPAGGPVKHLWIECGDTIDDGDTFAVDLANYGGGSAPVLLGVKGWIQTTAGSVVVAEDPTTAVATSTVTLTVGGSTDNKKRTYELIYRQKSSE